MLKFFLFHMQCIFRLEGTLEVSIVSDCGSSLGSLFMTTKVHNDRLSFSKRNGEENSECKSAPHNFRI